MGPQVAQGRGAPLPSYHEARPSTAPSRGRRWGMVQGSPQLDLFPRVPLPDGPLAKGVFPAPRPVPGSKPGPPGTPCSDEESACRNSDTADESRCVDADACAAEDETREQEACDRGLFEPRIGSVAEGVPRGAAWERYLSLVAKRHVFAPPEAAVPLALASPRAKRGVFGDPWMPAQDSAIHQGGGGQIPGSPATDGTSNPECTKGQGRDGDASTARGPDMRNEGGDQAPRAEKHAQEEAPGPNKHWQGVPLGVRPTTAPGPGRGAERRIRAMVRALEARSQGLVASSLHDTFFRPAQAPQPGEDPGKGASELPPEDAAAAECAARAPLEECLDAPAASPAPAGVPPRPRLQAAERMAYLGRSRRPYVATRQSAADRMADRMADGNTDRMGDRMSAAYLGRGRVFPGAGTGQAAAGSIHRKLAKSQNTEVKGMRPRFPSTRADSRRGSTPGCSAGRDTGSSDSGTGKAAQGVACEEMQETGSERDALPGGAPADLDAEDAPLPALKHMPWALREEPNSPRAFSRWPLGGQGSVGSEEREVAAEGSKQTPGAAFPALKHMSWSLEDKDGPDDLATLLRRRLAEWTRSAQQAAWPGTAAGATAEAAGQQAQEPGLLGDASPALRFKGSPDSGDAPGDSDGAIACVCESEDCSHSSGEEEGGKGEEEEEEEAVFHDCLDSDDISQNATDCSDASSESPCVSDRGQKLMKAFAAVEVPFAAAVPEDSLSAESSPVQPLSPLQVGAAATVHGVQAGAWLAGITQSQHSTPPQRASEIGVLQSSPQAAMVVGGRAPVQRSRTADSLLPELSAAGKSDVLWATCSCTASLVPRGHTADSGKLTEVHQEQTQRGRADSGAPGVLPEREPAGSGPIEKAPPNAHGHPQGPCAESSCEEQDSATSGVPGPADLGLAPEECLQQYSMLDSLLRTGDLEGPWIEEEAERVSEGRDGRLPEEPATVAGSGVEAVFWSPRGGLTEGLGQAQHSGEEGTDQAPRDETARGRLEDEPERGSEGPSVEQKLGFMRTEPDGATPVTVPALGHAEDTPGDAEAPVSFGGAPAEIPGEDPQEAEEGPCPPGEKGTPWEARAEGSSEGLVLVLVLGPFSDEGSAGREALEGRRRKLASLHAELEDLLRDSCGGLEMGMAPQLDSSFSVHQEGVHPVDTPWALHPFAGKAGLMEVAIRPCAKEDYVAMLFRGERVCTFQDGIEVWEAPEVGYEHQLLMESAVAAVSEFYFSCCAY